MIDIYHKEKIAFLDKDNKTIFLNYQTNNILDSISLSLPSTQKLYTWEYRFPPYFEMFLPEGYLYEIFKNILSKKYGYVDDYLIFELLANNIENRITFKTDKKVKQFENIELNDIIQNDTTDTFNNLLNMFLEKNAISGVQPKTIALIKDKESLNLKEYIIKTWGDEFPYLAENEYICMKILKKANIPTANVILSKNKKFLIVEKFIYENNQILGFEEILSLMDKNKINKYQGSYEQIAKIIHSFVSNPKEDMKNFFKLIVMNFYLKNGDAHLKNFGLLFKDDFSKIWFAPAYDVINTVVYIFKDTPALTLNSKKVWWNDEELIKFGKKYCLLNDKEIKNIINECKTALYFGIEYIQQYIKNNPHFKNIGKKMIDTFNLSLENKTIKRIDNELIRNWKHY